MAFFKNRNFNLIYVHAALQSIAAHGGEAFAFVYLLKAGIAVPVVLLCIGGLFGSRILLRNLVLPTVQRIGLRRSFILGILLEASTYPVLSQISGPGPLLVAYLALFATSSSYYWTCYHSYVALIGDAEHRGAQVSGLEFIGTFVGIVAPIASGLMLTYFSPLTAFTIVGLAMAASAIPILMGPERSIPAEATIPADTRTTAWRAMFADGLRAALFHFTWLIALFITLKENFASFGGALALAGVVGAIMGLFVGRTIDVGKGRRALQWGMLAIGLAILCRAFGYADPWTAVLANAATAVAWPVYAISTNARMYDLSHQSTCTLRFNIIAEGGWDTGTATGCVCAAAMTYFGLSFFWPLLLAMCGCALSYLVLVGSYEHAPAR